MAGTTQDEDVPREERLGELLRINEEVAEVTEAAAEAAAKALEAAEAARRARKSRAKRTRRADPATAVVSVSGAPTGEVDAPTAWTASPGPKPETRQRRKNVISLRLDDDELERVRKVAAETGEPLAATVRSLLVRALDRGSAT